MGDSISRQAALDAFGLSDKTRKFGGDHSGYDTRMLYEIQDVLEDLPAVEPERKTGRWIPCSERMPNKDDICLICGKNGGIYVARLRGNETLTLWIRTGTGKIITAVAWMPLPEPYEESKA